MANVYSKIYLQFVFAVQGRQSYVLESFREELQRYITGLVQARNQKLLAIYCMPDHIHFLIGYRPSIPIPDLVKEVKAYSSRHVNETRWLRGKFQWQSGYGVFSYRRENIDEIINYIRTQPEHHRKKSFKEEYLVLLKEFEIDFDEKYLFEWSDDEGQKNGE